MPKSDIINKGLSSVLGARKKTEFGTVLKVGCIFLAIIVDIIEILLYFALIVGGVIGDPIVDAIDWIIFRLIFWYKGAQRVSLFNWASVTEIIPVVNILPLTTISVALTIKNHNREVVAEIASQNEAAARAAAEDAYWKDELVKANRAKEAERIAASRNSTSAGF